MSVVVLISGRGSNLQALIEAGVPVSAVISNVAGADGLAIAITHGIPTRVVKHAGFPTREAFDGALASEIDRFSPRLVALAGFMRVLTPGFAQRYRDRMLNIHPSLLPAFPGLNTHERALAEGVKLHGCSVHFVTADLDHGPIVAQAARIVVPSGTLAARPSMVSATAGGWARRGRPIGINVIAWLDMFRLPPRRRASVV